MPDVPPHLQPAIDLGAELRSGWRRADPVIEADAKALWRRLSVLPAGVDPDMRADEIVAAAYVGDQLAAVSTAFVRDIEFLRQRFAMYRCAVAPEYRRHSVARLITGFSRDVLEAWSLAHPEEAVMGMAAVMQAAEFQGQLGRPVKRASRLVLVGYTAEGEKLYVAWFDHARV